MINSNEARVFLNVLNIDCRSRTLKNISYLDFYRAYGCLGKDLGAKSRAKKELLKLTEVGLVVQFHKLGFNFAGDEKEAKIRLMEIASNNNLSNRISMRGLKEYLDSINAVEKEPAEIVIKIKYKFGVSDKNSRTLYKKWRECLNDRDFFKIRA